MNLEDSPTSLQHPAMIPLICLRRKSPLISHPIPSQHLPSQHQLHSLRLTAKAPENRPKPKRKRSSSNHPFSGVNSLLVSGRVTESKKEKNFLLCLKDKVARTNVFEWIILGIPICHQAILSFTKLSSTRMSWMSWMWQATRFWKGTAKPNKPTTVRVFGERQYFWATKSQEPTTR